MATMVTTTATVTKQVKLLPSVKRQLLVELQAAHKAKLAKDAAEERYDKAKAKIRELREATGEDTLEVDGYTITNVVGTTTSWDEKKMLRHGLSVAEIESFKTVKPKKAYEKVTFPSADALPKEDPLRKAVRVAQGAHEDYHGE